MAANVSRERRVVLLIGTRKGAFIAISDEGRRAWDISDLMIQGSNVFHIAYDTNTGTVMAAVNHPVYGPEVYFSRDLGVNWQTSKNPPRFPEASGLTLQRVWHILPGRPCEPGVVYLGVEPAALFRSVDGGRYVARRCRIDRASHEGSVVSWSGRTDTAQHCVGPREAGANVGWHLCRRRIPHGGLGESWIPVNTNVRADFLPDRHPRVGQCPHKLLGSPEVPSLLYQQNHCGVYRSENGGDHWDDISDGLPSRFGLPMALHPRDASTAYVLPEDSATGDELGGAYRFVPDGRFRVFRTRDYGKNWEGLSKQAASTESLPPRDARVYGNRRLRPRRRVR